MDWKYLCHPVKVHISVPAIIIMDKNIASSKKLQSLFGNTNGG